MPEPTVDELKQEVANLKAEVAEAWAACDEADTNANRLRHRNADLARLLRHEKEESQAWHSLANKFERDLARYTPAGFSAGATIGEQGVTVSAYLAALLAKGENDEHHD